MPKEKKVDEKKDLENKNKIAKKSRLKYFRYFNSTIIAEFIINKSFDIKKKYYWESIN